MTGAVNRPVATTLEVAPGDSLWSLTARLLPDDAPVSAVAAGWHLLYTANRAVIGDDPDLLRPGQRLRVDRSLTDLARSAAQHSSTTSTDRRSP